MFDNARNDPFASIDTANAKGQRNPYLLDGTYHLKVLSCNFFTSREKDEFFIVELEILSSDNNDRPVGMIVSWMTKLNNDMGPINTKRFLAAANGLEPNSDEANAEITGEVARLAVSDEQPLANAEVFAACRTVLTKKKTDFLDVAWKPIN